MMPGQSQPGPPPPPMTGPPPPQAAPTPRPPSPRDIFEEALKLLRSDTMRSYRIDIETDQMVLDDQQQEQQNRIQFIQAVGGFLQQALPALQVYPQAAPVLLEMLQFGVRGFKTGRGLEAAFEEAGDQLMEAKANPQPQQAQQDQQAQTDQAKLQLEQQRLQSDQQKAQADTQLATQKAENDVQAKQAEIGLKAREVAAMEAKLAAETNKTNTDARVAMAQHNHAMVQEAADPAMAQHPLMVAMQGMQQQVATTIAAMRDDLQRTSTDAQSLAAAVQGLLAHINAPSEVVRGPDGTLVAMRKGATIKPVVRDANNRIVGTGPATVQ